MRYGIASGLLWGLDTVILGLALLCAPFVDAAQALMLASLAAAFLHDAFCALWLCVYMGVKGRMRETLVALKTKSGRAVMLAALLGGPLGMSGYLIAIDNIGPAYTAIVSAFYPAVGAVLAVVFLKERMSLVQVLALMCALAAIMVLGAHSVEGGQIKNAILGFAGALVCVFGWGSEAVLCAWGMRDEAVDNEVALHLRECVSALVYGCVLIPLVSGQDFVLRAIPEQSNLIIGLAAFAGVASYLFYYKGIACVGAARAMALNISYSAWAIIFSLIILHTVPSPLEIVCCVVILLGTIFAATNWKELRAKAI